MNYPPSPSSSTSSLEKFYSVTVYFVTGEVSTERKHSFLEITGNRDEWSEDIIDHRTKLTICLEESVLDIFLCEQKNYPEFASSHQWIEHFWEPVFPPRSVGGVN